MRLSGPAVTVLLSTLFSFSTAEQITVATIYRYVNATATVYQSYCPCPATAAPPLAVATSKAAGSSGATYVNNNNNGAGVGATSGSTGSGSTGSGSTGSGSTNGGSSNTGSTGSSNNGAGGVVVAAGPVVTTYQTVIVQYVTSTQYSTYTTTVVGNAGTSTVVLTNTVTVTVPVTSTATVTATVTPPSGGSGIGAGQNSISAPGAPYANSSTASIVLSASTASVVSPIVTLTDSSVTISPTSIPAQTTSSALGGGAGVDPAQNTLSSSSTLDSLTLSATDSMSSTADLPASTTTGSPVTLAVPTSDISTSSAMAMSTASSSSAAAPTATTGIFNLLAQALGDGFEYNMYITNDDDPRPAIYQNAENSATTDPYFVFDLTPGGNTVMDAFGFYLAYDPTQLAAGTPLIQQGADTSFTYDTWTVSADATTLSIDGITFYMALETGYPVYVTSDTTPRSYSWTTFVMQNATGASIDPPASQD